MTCDPVASDSLATVTADTHGVVLRSFCVVATAAVLSVLSATLSPERTDRDAMELPFDGPEPGPELQSAEAAEPVGGGLYDFLSAVWRLRL